MNTNKSGSLDDEPFYHGTRADLRIGDIQNSTGIKLRWIGAAS
jgi:hypothetical protein